MTKDASDLTKPFWRSLAGLVLLGFLAIGAFFLIAEHRAHIFTGSLGLALLLAACLAMHLFHGRRGGDREREAHDHGPAAGRGD